MNVVGSAAPGLYVIDCGAGNASVLHVREREVVLFNPHPLPEELRRACVPCELRAHALMRLVGLVQRLGAPDDLAEGTVAVEREQLPDAGRALARFLAAS